MKNKAIMITKRIFLMICITLLVQRGVAQDTAQFIDSVKTNHPALKSLEKLDAASRAESRTGLYPSGPDISAGWHPGTREGSGIKRTWSVSQSFDFPTIYGRIAELKRSDLSLAIAMSRQLETEILADAGNSVIEYIALLKRIDVAELRVRNMEKLVMAYSLMVDNGEATILELNRVTAEAVTLRSELAGLRGEVSSIAIHLNYISGNNSQLITGDKYPVFPVADREELLKEKRELHPGFAVNRMQVEKADAGLKVSKTSRLPRVTVGYSSESVAGEEFIGPMAGLSIPLWEKSGNVSAARAALEWEKSKAAADMTRLENETLSLLNAFEAVSANLKEVRDYAEGSEAGKLLDISLQTGAITLTEYLAGLQDYWAVEEVILDLEREKILLLSAIWDHRW
ncbi:MAG: TolC family protein [Bacteroidales bacterium]|nr:TolC family protein [Bacteroidales bacterium]